jgi:hypothetical protein
MENRRTFFSKIAGVMAMAVVMTTGCSLSSIETDIMNYVPLILSGLTAVLTFIPGTQGVAAIVALIKVGTADLILAIKAYQAAPATTSFGQKIVLVIEDIITNFKDLVAQIPGSAVVNSLVGIIISTLAGFAQVLPQPAGMRVNLRMPGNRNLVPVRRSKSKFIKDFNDASVAAGHAPLLTPSGAPVVS